MNIKEALRGCRVGRIQTVGLMQVVPLTMDPDHFDDRFATPDVVRVGTSHYGSMHFDNPESKPVLLPSHVGYVVKQKAQDHAMATAGIVPGRGQRKWDNAMCIQASQGGSITQGQHDMLILPLALREPALKMREDRNYGKLWSSIGTLSSSTGLHGSQNLVHFVQGFERQLDEFVAEFEIVDDQVGAIILINGDVVGVERAPSAQYWRKIWEPLIRVCYGSAAIVASRQQTTVDKVLKSRVPLEVVDLTSIDGIVAALETAESKQDELAKRTVRQLLDVPFSEEVQERGRAQTLITTVRNEQFTGQIATDETSSKVLYVSLVVASAWDAKKGWRLAEEFDI